MRLQLILIYIFLITSTVSEDDDDAPIVSIPEGQIQGIYLKSRGERTYSGFMGIPYAKKTERFELSEPASSWEGIRDASKFGVICPQLNPVTQKVEGDEDCLLVNVFTPDINGDLPVMVFIHGGGFQFGQSNENGADYLMDEDVVFVTINYRLAALGFLTAENNILPGNLGLKDQLLGLKWVQKNIKYFGGNPDKVMLFGESAGGASVSYHVISPQSSGLFRYAICTSGTALNKWALIDNPLPAVFELAQRLDCPIDAPVLLKKCLKTKSIEEILSQVLISGPLDNMIVFGPIIEPPGDSAFITEHPQKSLEEGRFAKIPMVFTVNEDEGLLLYSAAVMKDESLREHLDENWMEMAPSLFFFNDPKYSKEKKQEISKLLRKFYFKDKPVSKETFQNLTDIFSDSMFIYHTRNTAILHAKHAPVWVSVLAYRGSWSQIFRYGYTEVLGMTHADDLQYLFSDERYPRFEPKSRSEFASKLIVKAWANFATYGDPNIQREEPEAGWPPVSEKEIESGKLNWLYLKVMPKFQVQPLGKRMKFWDRIYKKLDQVALSKDEL